MSDIRDIANPQPGFWAMRLVRGGPEVGTTIILRECIHETDDEDAEMERTPYLEGFIDGQAVSPLEVWTRRGREISREEYEFLVADSDWAKRNAPGDPKANPRKPIDLNTLPPIF